MSTATALEKYSRAKQALDDHIEDNKPTFQAHQKLVYNVIDAENELRDAVAEAGAGVSNGAVRVTYTPQSQTWADIEEIDRLVAAGKMTAADRNLIVKTQSRPPKITITPQQ